MGKGLTDVNIMRTTDLNTMGEISKAEKNPERETAEQMKIQVAEQRSLKDILDNLADEEFIVTIPIEKEEEENE